MDEGVWEAVRAVRPHLDELVGAAMAADVDAELAQARDDKASGLRQAMKCLEPIADPTFRGDRVVR